MVHLQKWSYDDDDDDDYDMFVFEAAPSVNHQYIAIDILIVTNSLTKWALSIISQWQLKFNHDSIKMMVSPLKIKCKDKTAYWDFLTIKLNYVRCSTTSLYSKNFGEQESFKRVQLVKRSRFDWLLTN